ncbi:MAG: hypothetical protein L0215_05175 [Gemmataceae bacterium]|nr:hypothetical protein [Gemmataceae bacterium]
MALPLFAITLFVSAFILFLVQPIIGKLILPKLGGTPQVWNTCMVFFQMVLLLGYFYTHFVSTKLSLRRQLLIHGLLLFVPFIILLPNGPFNVTEWVPPLGANPLFYTLGFLFAVVGIPFFVVSTSAPLLQKWFVYTGHPAAKDPYFLYGASNLGSLLALLAYPVFIEHVFDLRPQAWLWTICYIVLVVTVLVCVAAVWKPSGQAKLQFADAPPPPESPLAPAGEGAPAAPTSTAISATPTAAASAAAAIRKGQPPGKRPSIGAADTPSIHGDEMTTWRRLRWIGLAAVPSSLMLGVTTHITTDLSPIPLFWLIPLTLYLLSFILVFSRWPVVWVEQPHTLMLYLQPAAICVMLFVDMFGAMSQNLWGPIVCNVIGFFITALVCHGELAKDRPSTKHLTEFYLLMSVGGMVGGMFNAIVAPVIFIYVWEFGIAIVCACLVRPKLKESGWADELVAGFLNPASAAPAHKPKGKSHAHVAKPAAAADASLSTTMDWLLPGVVLLILVLTVFVFEGMIASLAQSFAGGARARDDSGLGWKMFLTYGIPLVIAAFFFGRPLRFGLAVAAVLIVHAIQDSRAGTTVYADRSYFGIIRVKESMEGRRLPDGTQIRLPYRQLIHGHIDHGMNFIKPDDKKFRGNPERDYSRLATTYYHRWGPAGVVMERFNWFPGPENTYWGDTRMPASLVGHSVSSLGTMNLPAGQLVALWSEPPFAVVGLGTGTMASYARPYQHCHYYEIDNHIRRLSLPVDAKTGYFTHQSLPSYLSKRTTYFNYLEEAIMRGSEVQVLMGDARLRMALPYANHHTNPDLGGGPQRFYHMMVVDAFSSDAIPAHLITRQAIEMYMEHLADDGVLCMHTSNRYVELPLVIAAVADNLGLSWRRGHDNYDRTKGAELGHYTSEWVMLARKPKDPNRIWPNPDGRDPLSYLFTPASAGNNRGEPYWTTPRADSRYLWTDDHYNLLQIMRW